MDNLNERFLDIIQKSLEEFLSSDPRSNKKLKPLHGSINKDLLEKIQAEGVDDIEKIKIISLDYDNKSEDIVKGRYYDKAVDISIKKDDISVGAIGVKFVMNNYMQNANNYFENMLGETANIRTARIPYFQVLILFDKMPYFKKGGELSKWEIISKETHLKKYIKLSEDNIDVYFHTPILTLLAILSLPKKITENKTITSKTSFKKKLKKLVECNQLKLNYSSRFSSTIFKDNVILNNYEEFLNRIISFFLFKGIFSK